MINSNACFAYFNKIRGIPFHWVRALYTDVAATNLDHPAIAHKRPVGAAGANRRRAHRATAAHDQPLVKDSDMFRYSDAGHKLG
jgi:hypothetical protein